MTAGPVWATDGGLGAWMVDRTSGAMCRLGLHSIVEASVGTVPTGRGPVLYCANHVSWWDGFLVRRFHRRRRQGPLYTIMLEGELRRRPALRRAGAIGLAPGSLSTTRNVTRFLGESATDPRSSVCLFPQGRIWPSTRRPLGFEPGMRLFAGAMGDPWIVPVGIHLEPLNHFRPTAFVLAGEATQWNEGLSPEGVERAVEALLDHLHSHIEQLGESAGNRPIALHETDMRSEHATDLPFS
ncbi:MAG: lysophospholipid acyltransferase family protein [Longimicrobiales bacterium]